MTPIGIIMNLITRGDMIRHTIHLLHHVSQEVLQQHTYFSNS